jgi:hypothetical protein
MWHPDQLDWFVFVAVVTSGLWAITNFLVITTRYTGIEYTSSFFRSNPQNALFAIQIFVALTVLAVKQCLSMAGCSLRISRASREQETWVLDMLALSDGMGLHALWHIVTARGRGNVNPANNDGDPPGILVSFRIIAVFQVLLEFGG